MASSRLERIGTIFTRVNGLLKSGAMKWEDRPIWYDVYKAFPPADEPRFDRPVPATPIRNIFYKEDVIRAKFQKDYKNIGAINFYTDSKTLTQRFLSIYKKLETEGTIPEDQIFQNAVDILNQERQSSHAGSADGEHSLASSFKQAQENLNKGGVNIDVKEILKD